MYRPFQEEIYYIYLWRGEDITDEVVLKGNLEKVFIEKILSSTKDSGVIEIYKVEDKGKKCELYKNIVVINEVELYDDKNSY
ncbi:MAG: hypothetical protein ACFFAO_16185 [Candidatus Hermodarchaeota archaeon]